METAQSEVLSLLIILQYQYQDMLLSEPQTNEASQEANQKSTQRQPKSVSDGSSQSSACRLVASEFEHKPQPYGLGDH
jgi:hypothetical protein